jgi:RNA polymerase sigma-70 factor (ECF subfamily)
MTTTTMTTTTTDPDRARTPGRETPTTTTTTTDRAPVTGMMTTTIGTTEITSSGSMWTTWHDEGVEERALVDAVRAGDRQAFAVLVDRETPAVYRACRRILGSPHDAEDVTQEAFVAAFRAIRSYRGDGSLRAWLLRIATRQAYRRLSQRRPQADLAAVPESRLADLEADPSRRAAVAEQRGAVRAAVAALPEPYREVVALRFFADLSLFEVAEATDRPINTVKTHLRRGLDRLRPLIGPREGRS